MLASQVNDYLARALKRSPRALELCAQLDGRALKLAVSGLDVAVVVTAATGALRLSGGAAGAADVTVSGSPVALLALAGGEVEAAIARGTVSISGDERLAQQFRELARLLRPDLEGALGGVLGRIPAHLATRALGSLAAWSRAARDSVLRNGADYLAHESRDLVPRAEAEGFLSGVEALRARLTRAEARAAGLAAQLERLPPRS
jgi:ubiquinone biosynthesis protein UbiJ